MHELTEKLAYLLPRETFKIIESEVDSIIITWLKEKAMKLSRIFPKAHLTHKERADLFGEMLGLSKQSEPKEWYYDKNDHGKIKFKPSDVIPPPVQESMEDFKPNPESGKSEIGQYSQGHGHINQQVCPQCGYCPCCGRPRGNFNYPQYPYYPWTQPITPMHQVHCRTTTMPPATCNT